ncbi:MAG: SDR family NAD(P)-dependent oxidoreductase [Candidatus Hydrogenedentes bacterium]|nr:SDR family NAD(P)-dependent oxidoreductase [Candidatus Hydrogenedentota bacterium]
MRRLESWQGKVTVITGASSGIGRLLAIHAAKAGALVVLVARNEERLTAVSSEIQATGGKADVVICDVSDRDAVFRAAQAILERHGRVDVLLNNAGYGRHLRFAEWDLNDIERMVQVNLLGAIFWTKALLPHMLDRGSGWLVFVASVAGKLGVPDESVYCATKFAMIGMAESISIEVEDAGIHVLTVCPGAIDTEFFSEEMLRRMPPVAKKNMIRPERLVAEIMNALAKGKREITVPRSIAAGYIARTLFPRFTRAMVKRVALRPVE